MTLPQALSFAVIFGMLVLFLWDRIRYDLVALLALLASVACGIVPFDHAFSGFSNPLLPLIASALVVSAAVGKSGVLDHLLRPLRPVMRSPDLQVAVLAGAVTLLSALVKNVGALALFLPIAIQSAQRSNRSPSELLMPLSFGSLIGGMITLIGTSPNLIISSVRQSLLGKPYQMFDFAPVGLGLAAVGVVFVSFGWRLLPRRRRGGEMLDAPFRIEDYITEARVPPASPAVGKTVRELEDLSEGDVMVTAVVREGGRRYTPASDWEIYPDDVLVLESDPQALDRFVDAAKLELAGSKEIEESKDEKEKRPRPPEIGVVEAVVMASSPMIGSSPTGLRLRQRFNVNLLAVSRRGRRSTARLRHMRFAEGDVVVLQGRADSLPDAVSELGCLPLAERNLALGRPRRVYPPLLLLLAAVGLSASELVPAAVAFLGAATLIGVTRILTLEEIYRSIDWPILVLLGALIPVGEAMRATGATDLIAGSLASVAAILPVMLTLAMVQVVTMMATPLLHHAVAVIVMGPIAASLAGKLGVNTDPFLMAVAVGASCDFLSPIGHQCNTLVMGPGGYRFTDYWRLGLPLSILVVVLGVPLIALVWPLH